MRRYRFLLPALLVLSFAGPSRADFLLFSNLAQPDSGSVSFNNLQVRHASDFLTDGTPRTVTSITALLDNSDSDPHRVIFSIFTDSGHAPGSLVGAFATPAMVPAGAAGTFTLTSPGIDLQANTPYWLVARLNEALRDPKTVDWHLTSSERTDGGPFSTVPATPIQGGNNDGVTYQPDIDGNLLFALNGPPIVPTPSSLMLLMIGGTVGAVGWWRRKRVTRTESTVF